jgi:transcriptional regulator with XRE-family HTH domain
VIGTHEKETPLISRAGEPTGAAPLEPLHERLRQRRLASGVDLEALARETKIQLRYFEAIEQGQVHLLPQGVYMRNFARIYLRAIGIEDPLEMQAAVDGLTTGVLRLPSQAHVPGAPMKPDRSAQIFWIALPIAAVVALVAIGVLLYFLVFAKDRQEGAEPATVAAQPTRVPARPTAVPTPAPVQMELRANRRVTVTVQSEGVEPRQMTLQKDETVTLSVSEPTTLEIGTAGAVAIVLDGQEVPAERLKGSRSVAIDPEDLSELFGDPEESP